MSIIENTHENTQTHENTHENTQRNARDDIKKIFKKVNFTALNLKKNLIENNNFKEEKLKIKTQEELRLYNLMNIKKFKFNDSIYGIVHIEIKYFVKMKNYDFYLKKIEEKTELAFNISKKYSNVKKAFIFLDLSDITQKNFSRKFIKIVFNNFKVKYNDTLELCFLYGNLKFINIVWPFIKVFIDKDTKEKIVLLN